MTTVLTVLKWVWLRAPLLAVLLAVHARASLQQAVRARDLDALEAILQRADRQLVNGIEGNGVTALHIAAATDQADVIGRLIRAGALVDCMTDTGFTPLHWAVSRRSLQAIAALLRNGADVSAVAGNGITPLHWAALRGYADIAEQLINAGADMEATTETGLTPLLMAVRQSAENPVALLLARTLVAREERAGLLMPGRELPEAPDVVARDADAWGEDPAVVGPVDVPLPERGAFLSVPIGLGELLEFVWIERLGIWSGKYEITNRQYRRFNPRHDSGRYEGLTLDAPDQPVVRVSWHDADRFCQWLNDTFSDRIPKDMRFRLPSNREWTILASCGDGRRYPWGNEWPPRYGNYSDVAARDQLSEWRGIADYNDGFAVAASVQDSGMNEWGIYGLGGNVWEWTLDWYDAAKRFKTRRGASWDFDGRESMEIAWIGFDRPEVRYHNIGFRVVVAPH